MIIKSIAVVFVLGVIVVVHELGHFISARSIGVAVQEFAVGIGPTLWKKQGKHTVYSVRCFPVGGFCLFDPHLEGNDRKGRPLSLADRKAFSKIYISLAGPAMNFVMTAALFIVLFSFIGVTTGYEAVVGEVNEGSAAQGAGILPGDRIVSIDGEALGSWQDLSRILADKKEGSTLIFLIQRGTETLSAAVTPNYNPEENRMMIGVVVDTKQAIIEKFSLLRSIGLGLSQTMVMIGALLEAVIQMITGKISISDNLSGFVGLAQVIGDTVSNGFSDTLFLTAFLSVNLGIMNLLPIPALDGGRVVMYLIELVRRRPLKLEVEGWINAVGFALLISLMIFLTIKDLVRLFGSP